MSGLMRSILLILPLSLMAGCSQGKVAIANEPLGSVYDKLTSMPSEADSFDLAHQAMGTEHYLEPDGGVLTWHFTMNGKDYCRVVAELEEEGPESTRVTVKEELAPDAADAAVASGDRRPDHTYLCRIAGIAGRESVAAALQNRAADTEAIMGHIKEYVAANPMAVVGAASAAMDAAADQVKWEDPCDAGPSKRCEDWETLQRVREEQRANQPPPPPGTFRMDSN